MPEAFEKAKADGYITNVCTVFPARMYNVGYTENWNNAYKFYNSFLLVQNYTTNSLTSYYFLKLRRKVFTSKFLK